MKRKNYRGRDKFSKYNKIISIFTTFFKLFPLNIRKKIFDYHRNIQGNLGIGLRYALLKTIAQACGDNVAISPGVYINNPHNLIIGKNVSIHPMCYIECGPFQDSCIQIGDNVSIAHGTTIICTSHTYMNEITDIIKDMPIKHKSIEICSNVWIGAKATILYGVRVESGCVIGANSLVNKNTERDGIYVGIPARRIKDRT